MTPPRSRQRRKEDRPAELLGAALDTFRKRGFAGTRMDDIAARAGVAKGTIYLYFPSKQAIFEALVRSSLLPVIDRVEAQMAEADRPASDRLRMLVAAFIRITADARLVALPRLVLAEAANFPDMARFYRQEVIGRGLALVGGIIRQGVETGEFRAIDPQIGTRLFMAPLVLGILWQTTFAPVEDTPLPIETLLAQHLDLFLGAIAKEGAS